MHAGTLRRRPRPTSSPPSASFTASRGSARPRRRCSTPPPASAGSRSGARRRRRAGWRSRVRHRCRCPRRATRFCRARCDKRTLAREGCDKLLGTGSADEEQDKRTLFVLCCAGAASRRCRLRRFCSSDAARARSTKATSDLSFALTGVPSVDTVAYRE